MYESIHLHSHRCIYLLYRCIYLFIYSINLSKNGSAFTTRSVFPMQAHTWPAGGGSRSHLNCEDDNRGRAAPRTTVPLPASSAASVIITDSAYIRSIWSFLPSLRPSPTTDIRYFKRPLSPCHAFNCSRCGVEQTGSGVGF